MISSEKIPGKSYLSIKYLDIDFSVLKKRMNIHAVERYLRKNGVSFYITDDFEFDDHMYLDTSPDPRAKYTEIGEVYGDSISEIKIKIKKLINELSPEKTKNNLEGYVKKVGDDFYYKGRLLNLSKNNDYYRVFNILFTLLPQGGEISYKELEEQVRVNIKRTKKLEQEKLRKLIQGSLTGKSESFTKYANITGYEDNGKPLLAVKRGFGIIFNNGY